MEWYKGTIIENSLESKEILKELKVIKKYKIVDWILDDVLITEDQIRKLGEYMSDGAWYMHFWKENSDCIIVVFKDKIFTISYSDKNTWHEAIQHGESIGIPEEQLDFLVY